MKRLVFLFLVLVLLSSSAYSAGLFTFLNKNRLVFYQTAGTDIDTNAETACAVGEVLYGDGSCAVPAGGAGDVNGEDISPQSVDIDANLGVQGDANFHDTIGVSSGTWLYGDLFGTDGTTKLFWDNDMGAFMAGFDPSATGWYSSAFGQGTQAIGDYSTAFGLDTTARGTYSFIVGEDGTADGFYSFAANYDNIAGGAASTALGYKTTAAGAASLSGGYSTGVRNIFALGEGSLAFGYSDANMIAKGKGSIALGYNAFAMNDYLITLSRDVNIVNDLNVGGDLNVAGDANLFNASAVSLHIDDNLHLTGTELYSTDTINAGKLCLAGNQTTGVKENLCFTQNNGWTTIGSDTGQVTTEWKMSFKLTDNYRVGLGTSNDFAQVWDTQGAQDFLRMSVDVGSAAQSGAIIIDNLATWYGRAMPQQYFDNPTLGIHSGAAVTEQTLYLQHDGTNGRIWLPIGKGDLMLDANTLVTGDLNVFRDLNVAGDGNIAGTLFTDNFCLTADTCYTDLDAVFQDDIGADCNPTFFVKGVDEDGTLDCGQPPGSSGLSDTFCVSSEGTEAGDFCVENYCAITVVDGAIQSTNCATGATTPLLFDWNGTYMRKVAANLFELKGVAMIPLEGYDVDSNFTFTILNPTTEREYFDYIYLNQRCHFTKQMGYKSYLPDQEPLGKDDELYIYLDTNGSGTFSFSDISIPAKCEGAEFINYQLEIDGYYENV